MTTRNVATKRSSSKKPAAVSAKRKRELAGRARAYLDAQPLLKKNTDAGFVARFNAGLMLDDAGELVPRPPMPAEATPKPNGNGTSDHQKAAVVEAVLDAAFPAEQQRRREDAPVLRRDVAPILLGECQDADFASLVYTLAGAEGHTKGVADAACHKAAAELQIVRHILETGALGRDGDLEAALIVMVDGIAQRLDAAGEIERRRIAARKGEVTP